MLTGAIPKAYRRVTGCGYWSIWEGYWSVREGYRSVQECYQSLHKSAEVEISTYERDLVGYWR
jgi:hypothetical protein